MRRLLVLRGGALGDFLVTLPALSLLRRRWPRAEIELVGNPAAGALAVARGLLDRVHPEAQARWATLHSDEPLPPALGDWLAGFDVVLSFWPDPDGDLRARFPVRPGQIFLSGTPWPARQPAAAHYCAPLTALGLSPGDLLHRLAPLVPLPAASGPVLIHPGSGSTAKNWGAGRWLEIAAALPAASTVLLGEAELARPLPPPIAAALREGASGFRFGGSAIGLIVQPPLEELLARLAAARAFLGHDSGVSHLAAAAGTRSLLLFGPTDPAVWAPPGPHIRVLRAPDGLDRLSPEDVLAAALALLRE